MYLVRSVGFAAGWLSGCRGEFWTGPVFISLFPPIPGRANEAEGLVGLAQQLRPQELEDHQVPWLGGSLSGQSPGHPGPGAGCLVDLRPPLLRVAGVLPSIYISENSHEEEKMGTTDFCVSENNFVKVLKDPTLCLSSDSSGPSALRASTLAISFSCLSLKLCLWNLVLKGK
nr:uncharacterized protein LOC105724036 isoform X2 [Aotus nancymaae]